MRIILFEIISAITTSGFTVTSYYSHWRPIWVVLLVVLMVIGGRSKAGRLKQSRVAIALKSITMYFKRLTLPKQIIKNSVYHHNNGEVITIDKSTTFDALMYIIIYLIGLSIGTIIISLYDYSVVDSLFELASSIGIISMSTQLLLCGHQHSVCYLDDLKLW